MRFYKKLYIGESIEKKKAKVIWKLKTRATLFDIYVIVYPKDGNEIEYFNSSFLKQKYYRKNKPMIIGIAKGIDETELLMEKIILDTHQYTGNYDINQYFHNIKNVK